MLRISWSCLVDLPKGLASANVKIVMEAAQNTNPGLRSIFLPSRAATSQLYLNSGELCSSQDIPQRLAGRVLFPGSFDPLHFGHLGIAKIIQDTVGVPPIFEIGRDHPTKGVLSDEQIRSRVEQFRGSGEVLVTSHLPRIVDKLVFFPYLRGVVMGADTLARFLDSRYYPEIKSIQELLRLLARDDLQVFVFQRAIHGTTVPCENILPESEGIGATFRKLPGQWNISSSEIRRRRGASSQNQLILPSRKPAPAIVPSPERVRGLIIGTAIGDALGLPVETLTPHQIRLKYGRISRYESPIDNPFLNGEVSAPGSTSDDFQLTAAVARVVAQHALDASTASILTALAASHLAEFQRSSLGWGRASIEGAMALQNSDGAITSFLNGKYRVKSEGNGIAMKIAPLALWSLTSGIAESELVTLIAEFSSITHPSTMAISSGISQVFAIRYCLSVAAESFDSASFVKEVVRGSQLGEQFFSQAGQNDSLTTRLAELPAVCQLSDDEIIAKFGGGSAYVFNSLPFSYAFFLRNFQTLDALYGVINAGGDTDSNGAIVGSLLGALHGDRIFPTSLSTEVEGRDLAIDIANEIILACTNNV